MLDDILRESTVVREWIEEGERRMALVALKGRFGALSEDLIAAINVADEATLQVVVARVATETLDQIRARLGL